MMLTGSRPRLDAALEASVLRPLPMPAVADPEQPGAIPLRIVTALSTSAHRDLPRPLAATHRSALEGTGRRPSRPLIRRWTALTLCSETPIAVPAGAADPMATVRWP